MANGLISAAMASGLGKGLGDAAQNGMQLVGYSLLQRERQAMEERRQMLMEQAAAAREQRGYAHAEKMQASNQDFQRGLIQEQRGSDILKTDLEHRYQSGEKAAERDFTSTENARNRESNAQIHDQANETTQRGQDITAEHGKATIETTKRGQDLTAEHGKESLEVQRRGQNITEQHGKDVVASQNKYYEALIAHHRAIEANATAQTDIQRAKAKNDLSETARELALLEKAQGQEYLKMANDPTLDDKNRSSLLKLAQLHFDRAAMHLGYTARDAGSGVQIKDPFEEFLPKSWRTPQPPPPAINRGEETLSRAKSEAEQRREATRRDAMEAMREHPDPATPPPPMTPPSPIMAPMERQRPTGMQQPGESVPTPPKPAPAPAPVIANVPRELPRALSRDTDQSAMERPNVIERPKAVERPVPQSRAQASMFPQQQRTESARGQGGTDLYAGLVDKEIDPTTEPDDLMASDEVATLTARKQYDLRDVYENYAEGKISGETLRSSVHAILDDAFGAIRAEAFARVFLGNSKPVKKVSDSRSSGLIGGAMLA